MSPRPNGEYELISEPVNNEGSPLLGSTEVRRRGGRGVLFSASKLAPLGLVLMVLAMVGAVVVVFHHPDSSALQEEVQAAQAQVHVDDDGVYSVTYPTDVPPEITFADLANRMLPPWFEATLKAVNYDLDPSTLSPQNCGNARKVLLLTRNLLDAFSPVYSQFSLWRKLRKQIDHGYERLGHLQDLDHSGVDYSDNLLKERLKDVLDWKVGFALFQQKHHVRHFVYREANPDKCTRQKSSHLFWGVMQTLPCGHDPAEMVIQNLGRVQMTTSASYWQVVQDYDSVLPLEREEQFHNLRKELRIFLDEYDLFGDVMLAEPNKDALEILYKAQSKLGHVNDAWTAHQIYVERQKHLDQQQELAAKIDTMWGDFKAWAQEENLTQVIESTLDMLS